MRKLVGPHMIDHANSCCARNPRKERRTQSTTISRECTPRWWGLGSGSKRLLLYATVVWHEAIKSCTIRHVMEGQYWDSLPGGSCSRVIVLHCEGCDWCVYHGWRIWLRRKMCTIHTVVGQVESGTNECQTKTANVMLLFKCDFYVALSLSVWSVDGDCH